MQRRPRFKRKGRRHGVEWKAYLLKGESVALVDTSARWSYKKLLKSLRRAGFLARERLAGLCLEVACTGRGKAIQPEASEVIGDCTPEKKSEARRS